MPIAALETSLMKGGLFDRDGYVSSDLRRNLISEQYLVMPMQIGKRRCDITR